MTKPEEDAAERIAMKLFSVMPGVPVLAQWGAQAQMPVTGCKREAPEHWHFCLAIAEEMVKLSGRVFVSPD